MEDAIYVTAAMPFTPLHRPVTNPNEDATSGKAATPFKDPHRPHTVLMEEVVSDSSPSQITGNANIVTSPGSSRYYVPTCKPELKPFIGQQFATMELGIEFYKRYAANCGFDIRRGSTKRSRDRSIIWKHVYCNKEGEKNLNASKNNDPKRRASMRCGCKAVLSLRLTAGVGYVAKIFVEEHTHPLCSDSLRHFMKMNRNLNVVHQNFVLNCARANIGPTKSFRLTKEVVGGYPNVGCTKVDFNNFKRDLKAYALGKDAQMLIDNLLKKCEICPAFYFAYDVDEKDRLTRLFWSDPICRRNYSAFGDVVSFDATYSTNRYNIPTKRWYDMIFAPFTGIDNHRRIVTFGAGLLSREDMDSYAWLFEKFEDCMGRCPRMLITDQDPGMKKALAIDRVFPTTRHRLCMWHISMKFADKLPAHLKNDSEFKKKIDSIIWDELLEPSDFDNRWVNIMNEFKLNDNKWFSKMFDKRRDWIPAYFRDCPLSGLLKTTSLSESVNSFFGKYLNQASNLVEFFMQYDSALDAQRHAQDQLNFENASVIPELKTPLAIEKHALAIYTNKVFIESQAEIFDACFSCRVLSIHTDDSSSVYKIEDGRKVAFDVLHNKTDDTYICSCKKFVRIGLLCCHIFCMLKESDIDVIPDKYILSRWMKLANLKASGKVVFDANATGPAIQDKKELVSRLYSVFYSCVGLVDGNIDKLNAFITTLTDHRDSLVNVESSSSIRTTKRQLFADYYGTEVPDVVNILPPAHVNTKGSGRRIKSSKEQAVESSKKPLRLCRLCNQKTNHDSRNCPEKPKVAV